MENRPQDHRYIHEVFDIEMPDNILKLIGYPGKAHYVGIFWDKNNDLIFDDGVDNACGFIRSNVYQLWLSSQMESKSLQSSDIRSENKQSTCMLIFSKNSHQLFIAPVSQGQIFLRQYARKHNFTSSLAELISESTLTKAMQGEMHLNDLKELLRDLIAPRGVNQRTDLLNASRDAFNEMKLWLDNTSGPKTKPIQKQVSSTRLH